MSTHASPSQRPRQIVPRPQRQDAHRRCRRDADLVDDAQHPADGAVAAAGQNSQVRHFLEQLEAHPGPPLRQVEHLPGIQQPLELLEQLQALIAAGLGIDEHDDGRHVRRGDRLYCERFVFLVLEKMGDGT